MLTRLFQMAICCVVLMFTLTADLLYSAEPTAIASNESTSPLVLVVMDPLAKELSCPCVKGYAQRE